MRNICEVSGCDSYVKSSGLCGKHVGRLKKHGHLKQTRPDDWGKRSKHALYPTWRWMKRMSSRHSLCSTWEDFWKFVDDVGDRPSPLHQLRREDSEGNYSPQNCRWVAKKPDESKAEYAKRWRKENPDKAKNNDLRTNFGITLEDYSKMHKEQNGMCAICGSKDDKQALSVDHCHTTGKIRGLLCNQCNRGLGMLGDTVERLRLAVDYLT